MSTLEEQVGAIKERDSVTARFSDGWNDGRTIIVSGTVYNPLNSQLAIGGHPLTGSSGKVAQGLLSIEAHEPAQPPIPAEPVGDCLVSDDQGAVWQRLGSGQWSRVHMMGGWSWEKVAKTVSVRVYRPEPSSERIEELITEYGGPLFNWAFSEQGVRDAFGRFTEALLGGES